MAPPCDLQVGQLSVRGLSVGGVETCIQIPQLGLLFDVGFAPRSFASTPRVFITHGHGDHAGALVPLLSNRMLLGIKSDLQVYAPAWICDALRTVVQAYESIQGAPYPVVIHPVEAGSQVDIGAGRFARAYRAVHVVPALGYTIWEGVKKLKPAFHDLPGPEIAKRKWAGEDLFDYRERPIVSFPGDTTAKVLDQQPHLYQSRVLVLESTYLDARRSPKQCHQHGHIHLNDVVERAAHFENEHVVFTHFSQAYRPREVLPLLRAALTPSSSAPSSSAGAFSPTLHALVPPGRTWPG